MCGIFGIQANKACVKYAVRFPLLGSPLFLQKTRITLRSLNLETLDCGLTSYTGSPSEFLSKSFASTSRRMEERERTSIRTNQNRLGVGPKKVALEGAIKSFPTASLPGKQTESEATEIGKSRDASPPRLLFALASGRNLAFPGP